MKIKLLISAIALLFVQTTFSQSKISGLALDMSSSEPVEFATIALLKEDSTFIKGTATDSKGQFIVDNIAKGNYLLSVTYVGYKKEYVTINNLEKDVDLGNILLQTSDMALGDVTVTANAIIRKADRQIVLPTESQIKASHNGMDLLQRLQLSRLTIDPFNKKINITGGGDVQLRINGALVEMADILALIPEDIIRIEYHDDPGLRYNNAGAVIDYITRRRESGGSVSGNFQNGISKIGYAEDNLAAKVNHKKSEFGLNTYWHYRRIHWTRENDERFFFPGGEEIHRVEEGSPTLFKDKQLNTALNYSLLEQDKYYLNVALRNNFSSTPNGFTDRISKIFSSYDSIPRAVTDHSTWRSNSPSLDVYYQRNLKNEQLLVFEVVGTYIDSRSTRLFEEETSEGLQSYFSDINGDKYSLIAEGIYEKNFKASKFSAGIRHNQSYLKNKYLGDATSQVNMNLAVTYAYSEYQLKKDKMSYMLGLGVMRTYYNQGDDTQETYIFRPNVRVTYKMNDSFFLRYNGYVSGYAPSIGDMNNVTQIIDPFQIRRGNPDLRPVWYTNNTATVGYHKGILDFEFFTQYNYDHKPVMEETLFEDGKFVRTQENQHAFHRLNLESMFRLKPLKEYITLSLTPGYRYFVSDGINYHHTYSNVYFRGALDANYKNWILSAMMYTPSNWFWGETMNQGENIHFISFGYNKPRWNLMLGAINLFSKVYSVDTRNYSALAPSLSRVATDNISPMFFVNFSFNLNFGRQYQSAKKRLNNNDSDAGMMSGAKK